MLDQLLFIGFPYAALALLIAGSIWRFRSGQYGYSALSSQLLERRRLQWGSLSWHAGILILFIGHLLPFLAPGIWRSLMSNTVLLIGVETIGAAAGVMALVGLMILAARRVLSAELQRVTSSMDVVVLVLLIAQIAIGLSVALQHRWGAQWFTGTLAPYLWGVLTLRPDVALVSGLPPLVRLHVLGGFLIFALVPFSRLFHAFAFPVVYLWRAPQKVVWNNPRRWETQPVAVRRADEGRRYFLRSAVATSAAGVLLGAGLADALLRYFRGPRMDEGEEVDLLRKKLNRLEMTAEARELELERKQKPYIRVAAMAELKTTDGKYFTDYLMRPALAFKDANGLPLLISAKCTHLGCTVASQVDPQGRILCPCHISYFDVKTGEPNAGSPAKAPLPLIAWVLMDGDGKIIAKKAPGGPVEGTPTAEQLRTAQVYIARQPAEERVA